MDTVLNAKVHYQGHYMGAVQYDPTKDLSYFRYTPDFVKTGIKLCPIHMPLRNDHTYHFPKLATDTFNTLPGLLNDSLPDRYGHAMINQWLAKQGRPANSMNPVEKLCYIGKRGMGALEYHPRLAQSPTNKIFKTDIESIQDLADLRLSQLSNLDANIKKDPDKALDQILCISTSAGGAYAKAIIAWNPVTGAIHSGQLNAPEGSEHYLLKIQKTFHQPGDFLLNEITKIEFAYNLMAKDAGLRLPASALIHSQDKCHIALKRFDRSHGKKIHMQTYAMLSHTDFSIPSEPYEGIFQVMQTLNMPASERQAMLAHLVFNICARNVDDHPKNISFLMPKPNRWEISPAYDLTYSMQYGNEAYANHHMSVNGKTRGVVPEDIKHLAGTYSIPGYKGIIQQVNQAIENWETYAQSAGLSEKSYQHIKKHLLTL